MQFYNRSVMEGLLMHIKTYKSGKNAFHVYVSLIWSSREGWTMVLVLACWPLLEVLLFMALRLMFSHLRLAYCTSAQYHMASSPVLPLIAGCMHVQSSLTIA